MFGMYQVVSSNIASIGHDAGAKVLRVKFHSGKTYEYDKVEEPTFVSMLTAESVGKFFHANFKNKPFRLV